MRFFCSVEALPHHPRVIFMNRITYYFSTILIAFALFASATPVLAQGFTSADTGLSETAQKAGFDITAACQHGASGGCIPYFIGVVVNVLLGLFGSLFLVLIMYGGFQYMFAQGEPEKIKSAKTTIVNAILGMIIVAASYAIANYVLTAISGVTSGS